MIILILGGKFRLNEVDNANVPRDFTEMGDFVFFYECIIKWAVSIFLLQQMAYINILLISNYEFSC